MGHLPFLLLHLSACLFLWVLLYVTIPAHLIYIAVRLQGRGVELKPTGGAAEVGSE